MAYHWSMLTHARSWTAIALCIEVAACGASQPSSQTPSGSQSGDETAAPADEPGRVRGFTRTAPADVPRDNERPERPEKVAADEHVPEETPAAQSPASKVRPHQNSSDPAIAAICEKLTRRASQKCAQHVASLYQSSCNHYLKQPGDCVEPIRRALECQFEASDDALCAHEADQNCLQLRRALKECQRGTSLPEQSTAEDLTLPTGWSEIRDEVLGFAVAMPPHATLDTTGKHRSWNAEEGGAQYHVTQLEPVAEKPTSQAWIRAIIGHVGTRCQKGLRLHGELELKGTTVVQYHTACPDKTEWHGMIHVFGGKTVATSYHAPAGVAGVQEPFFYSFRVQ